MTINISHTWRVTLPSRWVTSLGDRDLLAIEDSKPHAQLRTQLLFEWLLQNRAIVTLVLWEDKDAIALLHKAIDVCANIPDIYVNSYEAVMRDGIPFINAILEPDW
jgi:hypothetical protein